MYSLTMYWTHQAETRPTLCTYPTKEEAKRSATWLSQQPRVTMIEIVSPNGVVVDSIAR